MKKVYRILSLLLFLCIATGAYAQKWTRGQLLDDMDDIVGKQVVLWSPGTSDDHPQGYFNGNQKITQVIGEGSFAIIEEVEGKTVDGYQVYRLKHVATGLYIKDYDIKGDDYYFDGIDDEMTDDPNEAYEFTALVGDPNSEDDRSLATDEKQDMSETGFVFMRAKVSPKGRQYMGCHLNVVFFSPYTDTNLWNIYLAEELQGYDKVESYYNYYFPNGTVDYPAGTDPGYYKADIVAQVDAVLQEVEEAFNQDEIPNEQANDLCDRMKAAYELLHAEGSYIALSEGYYYIHDSRGSNMYMTAKKSSTDQGYLGADAIQVPEHLTLDFSGYVWKVIPSETEDLYYLQNLKTGEYMTGKTEKVNGNDFVALGADMGLIHVAPEGGDSKPSFILYPNGEAGNKFNTYVGDRAIGYWNDSNDPGNCFHFNTVPTEEVESMLAEIQQGAINDNLKQAYEKALEIYNKGIVLKSNCDADGADTFTSEGRLVNDPTQIFGNATEPSEGSIEALLDDDYTTFYHSEWSQNTTSDAHYLGIALPEPLEKIHVKIAKRLRTTGATVNNFPKTINLYACNDTTGGFVNAAWEYQGTFEVKYNTAVQMDLGTEEEPNIQEIADVIGRASLLCSKPFSYIRMDMVSYDGSRYFNLSKINAWPGEIDWDSSNIKEVDEATIKLLETALAAAKAELEAGKATQETIDALKAATEQFSKQLPDPSRLLEAISEAQTVADEKANLTGDEVGYYPTEALEALNKAIEVAQAAYQPIMQLDALNQAIATLQQAVDAFLASLRLPAAGEFYTFRGRSTKKYGDELVSYGAQVYSKNNAIEGAVWFTRPDGASLGDVEGELIDTVSATEDLKYLWLIEKAEAGKLVLRNVGTGMYFAPQNGKILQSTQPQEIQVYLAQPGIFMLDAGDGKQVNANAGGDVVGWKDMTDENAWWAFEQVDKSLLGGDACYTYWEAKPEQMQIMTLPTNVSFSFDGTIYSVIGITEDNKLALAEMDSDVPAGTPFVFAASEELTKTGLASFMIAYDAAEGNLSEGGMPVYGFEPQPAIGLTGTLCEVDTVGVGYAYLYEGEVYETTKNTVIPVNSGYFCNHNGELTVVDAQEADAVIDLGEADITAIDRTNTVVLPSIVNVYTLNGTLIRHNVSANKATQGLPNGIYIIGGQKIIVKQ